VTHRKLLAVTASCLLSLAAASAGTWATEPSDAIGTWLTQDGRGVVRIEPCAQGLCGIIVGIARMPGEPMPTDSTERPQCGLVIFTGTGRMEDNTTAGRITDPRDGRTYQADLWRDEAGGLHLRGYIGVPLLGATQVWRPFSGRITAGAGPVSRPPIAIGADASVGTITAKDEIRINRSSRDTEQPAADIGAVTLEPFRAELSADERVAA
jgi:uncharacterized protein (DUF2147 family)